MILRSIFSPTITNRCKHSLFIESTNLSENAFKLGERGGKLNNVHTSIIKDFVKFRSILSVPIANQILLALYESIEAIC